MSHIQAPIRLPNCKTIFNYPTYSPFGDSINEEYLYWSAHANLDWHLYQWPHNNRARTASMSDMRSTVTLIVALRPTNHLRLFTSTLPACSVVPPYYIGLFLTFTSPHLPPATAWYLPHTYHIRTVLQASPRLLGSAIFQIGCYTLYVW